MEGKWSEEELLAAVAAYREMQRKEQEGIPFKKSDTYRDLAALYGRTAKSFEFRMQNISSVLGSMNQSWLPGLVPAKNVGSGVAKRLEAMLGLTQRQGERQSDLAAYRLKLPAMRSWLIGVARTRSVVRYGELMAVFELDRFSLRHALARLGHQSEDLGEPIITALVVNKATGHCSAGIATEFKVRDDAAERARLYSFWVAKKAKADSLPASHASATARAARFAEVEVRPDQAAFRRAVFRECAECCVISGCDVQEALDAAHRHGRDWRLGHNSGGDGFLLRKDLHALYDSGLLIIGSDGLVSIGPEIRSHYGELHGKRISVSGSAPS